MKKLPLCPECVYNWESHCNYGTFVKEIDPYKGIQRSFKRNRQSNNNYSCKKFKSNLFRFNPLFSSWSVWVYSTALAATCAALIAALITTFEVTSLEKLRTMLTAGGIVLVTGGMIILRSLRVYKVVTGEGFKKVTALDKFNFYKGDKR